MRILKHLTVSSCILAAALATTAVKAGTNEDLQALLQQIKEDRVTESKENKSREAKFKAEKDQRQALLAKAQAELKAEQARMDNLKTAYDDNEKQLTELKETLEQRKGSLGEMFGLVRQTANDTKGVFQASMVTAQYPERMALMSSLAESTALPSIDELEKFWIELYQAMTASGEVTRFDATVVYGEGDQAEKSVTRIGTFNAIADGKYLNYSAQTGKFEQLSRQPESAMLELAAGLENANDGYQPFFIDPSRGVILSLLVQSPSLEERVQQGGAVGYVILALGAVGLLLALFGYLRLSYIQSGVKKQLKSKDVIRGNPMGDIMQTYQDNKDADVETLELKLDEVIMKNAPKLEKGVGFIKLFASVAPLLGLLGTVIGMIATFQAITLFGTGDPKLMAGGISEALVTTMLGLIVAVPLVFAHTLVNGKSRRLIQTLEEQSAGFIALHKEAEAAR
ncbi:MotA/TolQ/ExbB proton channel family protein [Hahella sp. KA22]|uniref:MotA/TolQ/ExbB proton channel family protein n=1 Tax=Hahella sp. KA22 TaxID=1628392 RepID=UPI000FDDAEA4|nr:MotA/TolQ/ExbB proton channel family protein [Hahella sp. KA22]AZZ94288.1 MotA/TolQ/ExbB proton channel family protein [Hahella sp. KA22]QAY57662.1 MotA/TolQ/ExbB proton channel family protein [Hahella sp. KA22]